MKELTVRDMVKIEQEMDAGTQPYVTCPEYGSSGRWAVQPEVVQMLGLKSGQTVSRVILGEILRLQLALVEEELRNLGEGGKTWER